MGPSTCRQCELVAQCSGISLVTSASHTLAVVPINYFLFTYSILADFSAYHVLLLVIKTDLTRF